MGEQYRLEDMPFHKIERLGFMITGRIMRHPCKDWGVYQLTVWYHLDGKLESEPLENEAIAQDFINDYLAVRAS